MASPKKRYGMDLSYRDWRHEARQCVKEKFFSTHQWTFVWGEWAVTAAGALLTWVFGSPNAALNTFLLGAGIGLVLAVGFIACDIAYAPYWMAAHRDALWSRAVDGKDHEIVALRSAEGAKDAGPIVRYRRKCDGRTAYLHLENLISQDTFCAQVVEQGSKRPEKVSDWSAMFFVHWREGGQDKELAHGERADLVIAALTHEGTAHYVSPTEYQAERPYGFWLEVLGGPGGLRTSQSYGEGAAVNAHLYLVVQLMARKSGRVQRIAVRLTVTNESEGTGFVRNLAAPNPYEPWLEVVVGDSVDALAPLEPDPSGAVELSVAEGPTSERGLRLFVEEDVFGYIYPVDTPDELRYITYALVLLGLTVTNQEGQPVTLDVSVDLRLKRPTATGRSVVTVPVMSNPGLLNLGNANYGLLKVGAHETVECNVPLAINDIDALMTRQFETLADGDTPHLVRFHDRNTGLVKRCALKVYVKGEDD